MKKLTLIMATLVAGASSAFGATTIPKLNVFTCQIEKADIANWYSSYDGETDAAFKALAGPFVLKLEQAFLGGKEGLSTHYTVSVRSYNAQGKSDRRAQRTLEQVAVNYSGRAVSVGYAPYDISRTDAQPFSLLVQTNEDGKTARGLLSFVPLQTSQQKPFAVIQMPCEMGTMPAKAITLSVDELAAMPSATQFEILNGLDRVGQSTYSRTAQAPGLTDAVLTEVKARVSDTLSKRDVPALEETANRKSIPVTESRCGDVTFDSISPIYDSATYDQIRRSNESARAKAIGYRIDNVKCSKPAQVYDERYRETDAFSRREREWHADRIYISTKGLFGAESFKAASYNLW